MEVDDKTDKTPVSNPSDGEEVEQEDNLPRKSHGKKHRLFGGIGGNATWQDEVEDVRNDEKYESREGESVYDSPGGHRHTHRHKKFRRYHSESSNSTQHKHDTDMEQDEGGYVEDEGGDVEDEGGDVEDGEILEDGEIADDDEEEEAKPTNLKKSPGGESNKSSPGSSREHRHSHRRERHYEEEKEREGTEGGEEEIEKSRKDKKKKKKSKKDRHERKERDKKRRRHGRDYKDPDRPDDQDIVSFDKRSRSPPGSYEGQIYESPPSPYDKSSHHHSPSKKRGSPGQYDYHYDSPPGLYDSPSYDEDSEEGTPGLMRNASGGGYDGEYMDPDSQQHHSRKRKAGHSSRSRRRSEEGQINMPPRKKPLLEIPRHERPHCKFYMEGKCAKGLNCPFNHDFRPPRKPEICKFYLLSTCSKGEFCIFMHGDYPCKYFHTGAECYQGDNCKFSHDPLTDETRPLLEKLLHSDENDKPRPCLLGSPPRHLLEGGADPTKKIPSLFDIEVFPPGQNNSPRKPAPSSPSVRPSGYYKDPNSSTQAPGAGPPGNGPQLGQVPPVLNMIGAMLRRAPPDVVARAGAPNQGPPGMHGPRMHGPGMGPPPRGPYMGPGSSPDPRDNRGPGGPPDMRGPGPNFHRGPPPHMDQGGPMGPGGPMFDPRGPTMDQDPRGPQPGMMPGMDARGPPPGMDPRGMPPGMNQRGPNSMDPRGPPPGMDPRGPQMRMDPRDPRSQGMEQRDSRDPRSVDQRSSQMDPRDPRNQNMNSAGQEVPRTNSMDPRNQKLDPRDPRNQNNDSSESRDLHNNCDPRPQRGLLPDPPGIEKIIDPRQNYSEPRNVPFISKDPRSKVSNSRDPRSATIDRQDSQLCSAQSPPYEKDSVSEATATSDQRSGDISPGHESNMSPASHRDEKMEAIKSDVGGSDVSVKDGAVKMDDKIQDLNQDSQDTQDLSQEFLGERKEDEATTLEIASHLPPTQRNLFLRIRQQQHNLENPSDQGETTETSDDATPTVKGAESQDVEDDDWYSSDEDGGDAPKLMDVLKNLNKQPVPPPSSTASTINIMQMIQSIKNQAPTDKPSILSPSLTENLKQESPKRRSSTDTMKNSTPTKEVLHDHSSSTLSVNSYLSGAYPVIEAVLTSMTYRAKEFTLTGRKPYSTLPSHVDSKDPSYDSDPRVQKYISRMGKIKPPMSSPLNGETQAAKPASIDPRRARHLSIEEKTAGVSAPAAAAPKPLDPRVRRADPRTPADQPNPTIALATLEKAVSEQIAKALDSRGSDPRLQRVQSTPNPAMHNLPVRPVKDPRQDPRLGQAGPPPGGRPDPRGMNRQHSLDGRMNDPRNAPPFLNNEPRMGFDPRMGVGPDVRPPFDNRMPFNSRMPFGPGPGPRMGPGPMPRMPFGARMGGPDARMPFDPRMGPDQRMHNEGLLGDPRAINDPRSGGDPRSSGPGDPRSSGQGLIGDPRMGTGPVNDPRSGPPVKSDPRSNNKTDPRLANDPRSGDDPRSQGLQRTNSDPRSANADSSRQTGSIPAALLEPPKISSSDNANTSESESGWSDSQSGDQSGKRFDYRNDPRFKRKPASDTSEKGILVKKFTGQRKSSMEYSSPLGMDDSKSDGSSGYNSYNRPNPNQNKIPQKVGPWSKGSNNSPGGNSGSPSHPGQTVVPDISQQTGGLDPPVLPNLMNPPQVPLPNEPPLKDLFKSIDPTASPFC